MSKETATEYTDADGVRYVARDATKLCNGCASYEYGECSRAGEMPLCQKTLRADGRDIIWVEASK